MTEFAQFAALGVAIVSFCLSVTSLLVHYAKRGEHPLVAPLEAEILALRTSQVDVIDRLEQFVRRDRTRRLRAEQAEEIAPAPAGPPDKAQLREIARQRGLIR